MLSTDLPPPSLERSENRISSVSVHPFLDLLFIGRDDDFIFELRSEEEEEERGGKETTDDKKGRRRAREGFAK